jgi:hypothetical protein
MHGCAFLYIDQTQHNKKSIDSYLLFNIQLKSINFHPKVIISMISKKKDPWPCLRVFIEEAN